MKKWTANVGIDYGEGTKSHVYFGVCGVNASAGIGASPASLVLLVSAPPQESSVTSAIPSIPADYLLCARTSTMSNQTIDAFNL